MVRTWCFRTKGVTDFLILFEQHGIDVLADLNDTSPVWQPWFDNPAASPDVHRFVEHYKERLFEYEWIVHDLAHRKWHVPGVKLLVELGLKADAFDRVMIWAGIEIDDAKQFLFLLERSNFYDTPVMIRGILGSGKKEFMLEVFDTMLHWGRIKNEHICDMTHYPEAKNIFEILELLDKHKKPINHYEILRDYIMTKRSELFKKHVQKYPKSIGKK